MAFGAHHHRFRTGLYSRAGERLVAELNELYDHSERYRDLFLRAASEQLALYELARTDYLEILRAVLERDGERAATLVAEHLAQAALLLVARIQPDHDPKLLRLAMAHSPAGTATRGR